MHNKKKGHIWSEPQNVASVLEINTSHAAVNTTGFNTRALPESEQFDFWRGAASNFSELERPSAYEGRFHASVRNYFTPSIAFVQHETDHASRMLRDERMAARMEVDAICVQLRLGGQERYHEFDTQRLFSPGDIRVFELSKPVVSHNDSYYNIGVILNKQELADYVPLLDQLHGKTLPETPMTGLLKSHLVNIFKSLASMSQLEADMVSGITLETLRAVFMSTTIPGVIESEALNQPAFKLVLHYIDQNLHQSHLSPDIIAPAVGMSRSKLFRICKPYGTPMELVRARRMRRSMELMRENTTLTISQLSYLVGFENRETFARIFKATFGYSARDFQKSLPKSNIEAEGRVNAQAELLR